MEWQRGEDEPGWENFKPILEKKEKTAFERMRENFLYIVFAVVLSALVGALVGGYFVFVLAEEIFEYGTDWDTNPMMRVAFYAVAITVGVLVFSGMAVFWYFAGRGSKDSAR